MKEIPLSQGKVALIDDEDFDKVSGYKWSASRKDRNWYAVHSQWNPELKKVETLKMHRLIMGAPQELTVDHKNNNGLDNRRENLRLATKGQNSANARPKEGKRFKGVTKRPKQPNKPFDARIWFNYKTYFLGSFATEEEAARAYDEKAKELYGEFARLNFPDKNFFVK